MPAVGVGVDLDVVFLEALPTVVGTIALFPGRVWRLCDHHLGIVAEFWARSLNLLEIRVCFGHSGRGTQSSTQQEGAAIRVGEPMVMMLRVSPLFDNGLQGTLWGEGLCRVRDYVAAALTVV